MVNLPGATGIKVHRAVFSEAPLIDETLCLTKKHTKLFSSKRKVGVHNPIPSPPSSTHHHDRKCSIPDGALADAFPSTPPPPVKRPINQVRFVPTNFELYKTEEHWKQCFFTKQDTREARQDISQGFAGIEWKIIHSEVRAETENRRKEILRQQNHPFRRFCRFLGFRG